MKNTFALQRIIATSFMGAAIIVPAVSVASCSVAGIEPDVSNKIWNTGFIRTTANSKEYWNFVETYSQYRDINKALNYFNFLQFDLNSILDIAPGTINNITELGEFFKVLEYTINQTPTEITTSLLSRHFKYTFPEIGEPSRYKFNELDDAGKISAEEWIKSSFRRLNIKFEPNGGHEAQVTFWFTFETPKYDAKGLEVPGEVVEWQFNKRSYIEFPNLK